MASCSRATQIHFVALDSRLDAVARELESGEPCQWLRHDDLDALARQLDAAGEHEAPRALLICSDTRELATERLRALLHAAPRLRLVVATPQLLEAEERRLLVAGAIRVIQRPWPPLSLATLFEDRSYLATLFPGELPAQRREFHAFELPTDQSALAPLIRFVAERLDGFGAPGEFLRSTLPLILDEAIVNAMDHGNRWQAHKLVRIEVALDPDELELRVRDQGDGFDRTAIQDPTQAARLQREGGRGLFLMERLMDEVRYEDGGRTVVLRKSLRPAASPVG